MIGESEVQRLQNEQERVENWKRWGPYLPERQWGTVREDYSDKGEAWDHFPFEHAHLRAYRWGEDGLLGFCDRQCRVCLAPAFWNGQDPIIKERLFGLNGNQGNHGEDCKEVYYYLDSTPTHTYSKALYKYPQRAFPYEQLKSENANRGLNDPEFELSDTGAFEESRYFDATIEYAKGGPNDILARISVVNRGPETAFLSVLPKVWFRNTWIWGCEHEGCSLKPFIRTQGDGSLQLEREGLGFLRFVANTASNGTAPLIALAENETNTDHLYQSPSYTDHPKDSFHKWLIDDDERAVLFDGSGTMAMARYDLSIEPGETVSIDLRLFHEDEAPEEPFGNSFDDAFSSAKRQADAFWKERLSPGLDEEERSLQRQAYAGLLWTKQFYHYSVYDWLKGDDAIAPPPASRLQGRNHGWDHLFNRNIISMPDKWEYPWYAAWDLAFHMIPFAVFDPHFAKEQLILMLREWYMHPNGQLPAYEWALDDVNPPTHAWACWDVYVIGKKAGNPDIDFLKRAFSKLLLNFTWWVNRKDPNGNNLFGGGFLGLDNIGLFDRSKPMPGGGILHQADGTAWMAFYCAKMLSIALELALHDRSYSDVASKFFEHFMSISQAINNPATGGLWDEEDGFYYDEIVHPDGRSQRLKARSLVGLLPMIASLRLDSAEIDELPGFRKRADWYLQHRKDIVNEITALESSPCCKKRLLALTTKDRLLRLLRYLFDEDEFLSPFGIRSLSKKYQDEPYTVQINGEEHRIRYAPGDSDTYLFGGNSNWRGPIWFPMNFLIIESLDRFHDFYGSELQVEYPTGSGNHQSIGECARDLRKRLARLFKANSDGRRPWHGDQSIYATDPHFQPHQLFYEFFNADTGSGHGASHQTGWTALIATILDQLDREQPTGKD